MLSNRQIFLEHVAQTSDAPLMIEVDHAKGMYIFDVSGKKYLDLISGVSVCNIGHCNERVIYAIQSQLEKYSHLMVYGEFVESPQTQYAKLLTEHLPSSLNCVYFTNSGTEAIEGAMKLAKRITGRTKFISFNKSYHGHSQGALSIMGDEYWKQSFRPLLPNCFLFDFNDESVLESINEDVAAIVLEPVQAEAGIILPKNNFLKKIKDRCDEVNALLILDECQTGFGRTGSLFAFQQYDFVPDILVLAKALGGGMPLGAFISSNQNMHHLTHHPSLGHITTFGGHPVCCAAGKAAFEVLLDEKLTDRVSAMNELFKKHLQHKKIKEVRTAGLLIAVEFEDEIFCKKVVRNCIENGLLVDWFLFAQNCVRIAPPMIISEDEVCIACDIILNAINDMF
jgi:acetylornithine/N-succinyldiaminopimelate aminotransferase